MRRALSAAPVPARWHRLQGPGSHHHTDIFAAHPALAQHVELRRPHPKTEQAEVFVSRQSASDVLLTVGTGEGFPDARPDV